MNKLILMCLLIGSQFMISCGGTKEVAKAPLEMDKAAKHRMAERKKEKAADQTELYAKLDFLEDKQISKLKKIHTNYDEKRTVKIQKMIEDQHMDNEVLQALRDKETEDIKKIMTDEQYEKYFDLMLQIGSQKGAKGNRPPPPPKSK